MRTTFLFLALGLFCTTAIGRAAPPPPPVAVPAPSLWGERFHVDLTLLDIGGAPLVHRQFDAALGQTQSVGENHQGRTATVDATFSAGDRIGCVATKLVVVDRRIDTTGQFARTDWRVVGQFELRPGPTRWTLIRIGGMPNRCLNAQAGPETRTS